MLVRIKFFKGDIKDFPMRKLGDWIDLRARISVDYKKGDIVKIPLGIAMVLPHGYEAHMASRSSTAKNFGLIPANGFGIIDNDYCGDEDEWCYLGYAIKDGHVNTGDRVCQFRIFKNMENVEFIPVKFLGTESRGGFGSTGVK